MKTMYKVKVGDDWTTRIRPELEAFFVYEDENKAAIFSKEEVAEIVKISMKYNENESIEIIPVQVREVKTLEK